MKRSMMITGALVLALGTGVAGGAAHAESPAPTPRVPDVGTVLHGEQVVATDDGTEIRDAQTGKVTEASSGSLTVRSSDGTTWTWTRNADTRVVGDAVEVGDTVLAGGVRTGTTRTARRIANPAPDFDAIRERLKERMTDLPKDLPAPRPPA